MIGESVPGRSLTWRHLRFLFAASVLALLGLFATYAWQSYDRVYAQAEERLRRRASVLAEHVGRVFDNQATTIELAIHKLDGHADINDLSDWFTERARHDPVVGSMLAIGNDGQAVAGNVPATGIRYDDRDYFKSKDGGIYVGEQVQARALREPVFTLSRRWSGGVVVVGLRISAFQGLFARTIGEYMADGVVTLYRVDGRQLVRVPAVDKPVHLTPTTPGLMQNIPAAREGTYRMVPLVGKGGERLYAFRQVGGYPVWLSHGMDVALIRAEWLHGLMPSALLGVLVLTLLAIAFVVARLRERQSRDAEARLSAEARDALSERERALALAERANRAKSTFLASASHDLRQPIQGLRLFLDVLAGRLTDHTDRKVLGNAVTALEGAEGLLSTLLDVSTLEAGIIPVKVRPVALGEVMSELATEFSGQAAAHGLDFVVVPSRLWVRTDPVLLARMLRNLLTNALRYTPTGRVLLGCRRRGRQVSVEVWDTGQGIPEDQLDAVFEDFVQVGNPERDRAKGLGLGLAVVRRMAALLGHAVAVRSRLGRGTMFSVQLPLVSPHPLR